MTAHINLHLDPVLKRAFAKTVKAQGATQVGVLRRLIEDYVDQQTQRRQAIRRSRHALRDWKEAAR